MLQIFELIGRQIQALGTSAEAQFTATSALVHYIVGTAGQNATNADSSAVRGDRQDVLDTEAERWERLDPTEYSFTRTMAVQLRLHDDRAEFLAGIDLMLAGITSSPLLSDRTQRTRVLG